MELYLITGFLGAGKTTFLKQFIRCFAQKKIHLIINEFGKAGVDSGILQQLHATLDEINQGSIFCSCRLDQFEAVLEKALGQQPDVLLVEASGLSDPTNIEKILSAAKFSAIRYKGSICLVDPHRFEKVVSTARMCKKQVLVSSLALVNKCDTATPEQVEKVSAMLTALKPGIAIRTTSFGAFRTEWLSLIQPSHMQEEASHAPDITLQKACVQLAKGIPQRALQGMLALLADDTHRMKGFIRTQEQECLVNCVGSDIRIEPLPQGAVADGMLVLLAGQGMPLRQRMKQVKTCYSEWIEEITYG